MATERYIKSTGRRGFRIKYKGRLIAFLVLLTVIAAAVFLSSSYFDVKEDSVVVTGDERYHFDDIKNAATKELFNVSIFRLDEAAVARRIEEDNPYIEVKDIVRRLPNKVEIVVKEREPVFQFEHGGLFYDAAENCVIMSEGRSQDPSLMQIAGFEIEQPVRGQLLSAVNAAQQRDFDELMANLKKYGFMQQIKTVDMTQETNLILQTRSGFRVIVGLPTQLEGKISCLQAAVDSVINDGNTSGTLDISVVGNIYFTPDDK